MKLTLLRKAIALAVILSLISQPTFARNRTARGAFGGAATGALIGGLAGGGRGAGIGAAAGLVGGAMIGAAADANADDSTTVYVIRDRDNFDDDYYVVEGDEEDIPYEEVIYEEQPVQSRQSKKIKQSSSTSRTSQTRSRTPRSRSQQ